MTAKCSINSATGKVKKPFKDGCDYDHSEILDELSISKLNINLAEN